jgi:hypothetical protein
MDEERTTAEAGTGEPSASGNPPTQALEAPRQAPHEAGPQGGCLSRITAPVFDEIRRTMAGVLEKRKRTAAERLGSVAKGLRQVSQEVEQQNVLVSRLAGAAAGKAEDLSETIRERKIEEIARSAGDYLKKRPALVLGGGILAGFVIARLLRTAPGILQERGARERPPVEPPSEASGVH